jgi:hypothetical protein
MPMLAGREPAERELYGLATVQCKRLLIHWYVSVVRLALSFAFCRGGDLDSAGPMDQHPDGTVGRRREPPSAQGDIV